MPHAHSSSAASSGGDDLGSTDEVKVFKDEGDGEDEKRSSENLLEEKSSLIDWTESEEKSGEPYSGKLSVKSDLSPVFGKFEPHPAAGFNMGYLMAPYPYPNGGAHPLPVSMGSNVDYIQDDGWHQTGVGTDMNTGNVSNSSPIPGHNSVRENHYIRPGNSDFVEPHPYAASHFKYLTTKPRFPRRTPPAHRTNSTFNTPE
ncbi:unnamed protein product [Colias eurytheme]|nr:unnamed protein product [Colias eurytheme]